MTEMNHPITPTKTIVKATIVSVLIAILILVIAVLPAEYGIDPTGLGKILSLDKLHHASEKTVTLLPEETKTEQKRRVLKLENGGSDPSVPRPIEADAPAPEKQFEERQDSLQVIVPAGEGVEYKINMLKYGKIKYEWSTDESVFFDFHGEVKEKRPSDNVYYDSYTVSYSNNMIGSFLAPFEGRHGWYFQNTTKKALVITIRLKGQYELAIQH